MAFGEETCRHSVARNLWYYGRKGSMLVLRAIPIKKNWICIKTGSEPHYDDRSLRLLYCTFHFILMRIIVNIGSTFSNHTNFLIKSIVQHIFALSKNRTLKSRLLQANPEATVVFLECPYYSITRFNKLNITNSNSKTATNKHDQRNVFLLLVLLYPIQPQSSQCSYWMYAIRIYIPVLSIACAFRPDSLAWRNNVLFLVHLPAPIESCSG
jgi:hypothetical protein